VKKVESLPDGSQGERRKEKGESLPDGSQGESRKGMLGVFPQKSSSQKLGYFLAAAIIFYRTTFWLFSFLVLLRAGLSRWVYWCCGALFFRNYP